ncbi:MAG TPA: hypothetical protein VII12_17030 [Thermoanaerobaculia bacterium]
MNIACPKCGFEEPESARECSRCGIVFGKYGRPSPGPSGHPLPLARERDLAESSLAGGRVRGDDDEVTDGRLGASELTILGIGLVMAIVVYAIPFTRFVFSAIVTLFHEFGHAVMGWLLATPAIPAFDFVYGGGITPHWAFQPVLALLIAAGFVYLMWLFRQNRTTMMLIGAIFLVWLFFVSAEWRRGIAFSAAGHLAECILAGILFYQALSGVGWRIPELERPLGAFVAFFVQINMFFFCRNLIHDPDFLAWYREGKGGMLMNDLEEIALDLHIHTPFNPGIEGVARMLLVFSFLPIVVALIWYFQRARWHRVLRALRTADA